MPPGMVRTALATLDVPCAGATVATPIIYVALAAPCRAVACGPQQAHVPVTAQPRPPRLRYTWPRKRTRVVHEEM